MDSISSHATSLAPNEQADSEWGVLVSAFLGELRLVWPILVGWFLLWLPTIVYEARTPAYWEVSEYSTITLSSLGIAMTVLWCCLHGTFSVRRVASGLLLIVSVSMFGVLLTAWLNPQESFAELAVTIIGVLFVGLVAFVPGWGLRKLLGWQIRPFNKLSFEQDYRFGIQQILAWTFAVAGFLALLPFFAETLFPGADLVMQIRTAVFFALFTVVMPTFVILGYFTMVSRLRTRYLIWLMPVLGVVVGGFVSWMSFALLPNTSPAEVLNEFWRTTIYFSFAGYLLLAAVCYLRGQGLYFKVGISNHRRHASRAKQGYEELLRRRIRRSEELRTRSSQQLETSLAFELAGD